MAIQKVLKIASAVIVLLASLFVATAPVSADPAVIVAGARTGVAGRVWSIDIGGLTLYTGGSFTTVEPGSGAATVARAHLAAFDAMTGDYLPIFTPTTNTEVRAVAVSVDGSMVHIGGGFTTVNGVARSRLAALDPSTGATIGSWAAEVVGGNVLDIAVDDSWVYVGGGFSAVVGGSGHARLARFDAQTGVLDSTWNPAPTGGAVQGMKLDAYSGRLYVSGDFTDIGGSGRSYLAAVDTTTGAVVPSFAAQPGMKLFDVTVDPVNDVVYTANAGLGGRGQAWSAGTGTLLDEWFGDGDVQTVTLVGQDVYFGGHFAEGLTGNTGRYVASYDRTTRTPSINLDNFFTGNGGVWAIASVGDMLWLAGDIDSAQPNNCVGICRYDLSGTPPAAAVAPVSCTTTFLPGAQAQIDWIPDATDGGSEHLIRRSNLGGPLYWAGIVSAPGTTFVNNGLQATGSYQYTVESLLGGVSSAATACTTTTVPTAVSPLSCSATDLGGGQAQIDWVVDQQDGGDEYIIRRSRNAGPFFWAGRVSAPAASFIGGGLQNGSTYEYQVESRLGGVSDAPTTCTPILSIGSAGPVAPVSCTVTDVGMGAATVDWVAGPNDAGTAYVIRRSRDNGPFYWTGRVDAPVAAFTNGGIAGGSIYRYTVESLLDGTASAPTSCSPDLAL